MRERQIADPCEVCQRAVADGLKKQPDCEECSTTWLMAENEPALRVCRAIGSGLIVRYSEQTKDGVRAYRGANWQTIDAALNRFEIPREQWQPMIRKILAYASIIIERELRDMSQ